jgi:hypothetical protein
VRALIRICALLLACLSLSQLARAQDSEDEPPACNAKNSERVRLSELWRRSYDLSGECVALSGYRAGDVIFTDQTAYYAYQARRAKAPSGIVGIPYPGMNGADEGLMRGIYYGRVRLCNDDRASYRRSQVAVRKAAERGEIMLTHLYGFCASSSGPALRVDNADEAPVHNLVRLTGDGLRRRLGELVEPEPNYPYRATLAWLADLATEGSCAADFVPGAAPVGPPQAKGVPLRRPQGDSRRSRALALWCATAAKQQLTYLVSRTSPSAFEGGVALDMVHCVCTNEDCRQRWPVALIDAGWDPHRPYFCQRVKLRPQRWTSDGDGNSEYSDYSYEFSDDSIAGDAAGFPEVAKAAAGP